MTIQNMMTSSNENIFRVTGPLRREFTGHRWIPSQRQRFDVFLDQHLNKGWRHCNDAHRYQGYIIFVFYILSHTLSE